MAPEIIIHTFERDSDRKGYVSRISYKGTVESYRIGGSFISYGAPGNGFMICTQDSSIPENGDVEDMCISVKGLTSEARRLEDRVFEAFIKFVRSQGK